MKIWTFILLLVVVDAHAAGPEQYFCQTKDGVMADMVLDGKIRSVARQQKSCNGSIEDPDEWDCHIDYFTEESRLATVRILDSSRPTSVALNVYRYLREGQVPDDYYQGSASFASSYYSNLTISSSVGSYILFIETRSKDLIFRCQKV